MGQFKSHIWELYSPLLAILIISRTPIEFAINKVLDGRIIPYAMLLCVVTQREWNVECTRNIILGWQKLEHKKVVENNLYLSKPPRLPFAGYLWQNQPFSTWATLKRCEKVVENIKHNLNLLRSLFKLLWLYWQSIYPLMNERVLGGGAENRGGDIVAGQIIVKQEDTYYIALHCWGDVLPLCGGQ